jgi:Kef-type K+ transport system membrane component KefB
LFLAYQGVLFEAHALTDFVFMAALLAVAIASKLLGGYATARLSRLNHHDALGAGIVMNARGVVGMVVASIAYRAGLVDQALFSTLLLVCIVTSVMTPLMLKVWIKPPTPL